MDRKLEYDTLIDALNETPARLEYTVQRARARRSRERAGKFLGIPASSIAAFLIVFTALVNLFPTVAYAAGRVPVLKELARAVAFSPSLKAAVDNQYVQPLEMSQTQNGVTVKIEYVIMDRKQVNVFYSVSDDSARFEADVELPGMQSYAFDAGRQTEKGELRHFYLEFFQNDVPDTLTFKLHMWKSDTAEKPAQIGDTHVSTRPDYSGEFEFTISFDPYFTETGNVKAVNQWLELGSQRVLLKDIEVYPTHIRVNLGDDDSNSAWLHSLECSIVNENGEIIEKIKNGITATGSGESPFVSSHRMESNYFLKAKSFTLQITGAEWIDKAHERVTVDLKNQTVDWLPEGVEFVGAEQRGGIWEVTFSAPYKNGVEMKQLFGFDYYDQEGNVRYAGLSSTDLEDSGGLRFAFKMMLLEGLNGDTVILKPVFTDYTVFNPPVGIEIK